MEVLTIVAITLSGLTLTGVILDKVIQQFKDSESGFSFRFRSSCCNKHEHIDHNTTVRK